MNNPFVQEQAAALARRSAGDRPTATVGSSGPGSWPGAGGHAREHERASRYLERYADAMAPTAGASARTELEAWTSLCKVLLTANEFLYLD